MGYPHDYENLFHLHTLHTYETKKILVIEYYNLMNYEQFSVYAGPVI